MADKPTTLVICCGALARDIVTIVRRNGWDHMKVASLPAQLHNDPDQIPERVRKKIRDSRGKYDNILVLYADCGTGGRVGKVIDEEGVEGIGGIHCYEVFAGTEDFRAITEDEPGCFFVTDFLARHFERLVFRGLGLDRFPKLRDGYFRQYKKLVYLAQTDDPELLALARSAADSIGLEFELRRTGYGGFESFLSSH